MQLSNKTSTSTRLGALEMHILTSCGLRTQLMAPILSSTYDDSV